MADSMLEEILADLARPDSVMMADTLRAMLAGADDHEATAAGRASIAYAAVREIAPIIRQLRDQGVEPAAIRATVRRLVAAQTSRTEGFLDAVAERALDSALGPETAAGPRSLAPDPLPGHKGLSGLARPY